MNNSPKRTNGRLSPAIVQFNGVVQRTHLRLSVSRWITAAPLAQRPRCVADVVDEVVDEARNRIAQFHESPLTALAHSAVLNTAVYRDNSQDYATLQSSAEQQFAYLFT